MSTASPRRSTLRKCLCLLPILAVCFVSAVFFSNQTDVPISDAAPTSPDGIALSSCGPSGQCPPTNFTSVNKEDSQNVVADVQPIIIASHISLANVQVVQKLRDLKFYVHRAFLDDRYNETYVRIFGLEHMDLDTGNWQCRWRFKHGGTPDHVVNARKYHTFSKWPRSTIFYAFNFDCHFKVTIGLPGKVSDIELVSDKGYRLELPVEETIRLESKRELAVCTKPVSGKLNAIRFVEWIEIQRLAGIEHFIIYLGDVSGQANWVLEYYQQLGVLTVVSFPFYLGVLRQVEPPTINSKQRYGVVQQLHLVAMQDCLYRFRGAYRYLQFLDIDEVMLPVKQTQSWPVVMQDLAKHYPNAAGFLFNTAWHLEELGSVNDSTTPGYMYMLRYPRASVPSMQQPKSVIVTSRAVSVNYHSVLDVMAKQYGNQPVSWEKYGYVHHFRGKCTEKLSEADCKKMMADTRLDPVIIRYQDSLDQRVHTVKDFLQLT